MCGLAAIIKFDSTTCTADVIELMRDDVAYRGPDDMGTVYFRKDGASLTSMRPGQRDWILAMGHRRLSILDLSAAGHQPMCYEGRYWIVYNGEVYNYLELQEELVRAGRSFNSSSDTEVVVAAFAEWGVLAFSRFRGMWSLILYDSYKREIVLCRDRLGIKPLYVWKGAGLLAVASEIKQFLRVPGFRAEMDYASGMDYLQRGYEDPQRSLFQGVEPVCAGQWVRISVDTCNTVSSDDYWHPERVQVAVTDPDEAASLFADKLRECVSIHLRSDVSVGCALSGGLDSSAIAVIVNSISHNREDPLRTFTVSFPGEAVDESEYADAIASAIGARAYSVVPDPRRFIEDLDRFVWIHDEPVGSFSMYAGYCIARLTRESGIAVTLHGQGGDEVLSGYWQSYLLYLRRLHKDRNWIRLARHFTGALLRDGNASLWGQLPPMAYRYFSRSRAGMATGKGGGRDLLREIMSLDDKSARLFQIRTMFLPRLLKWDDRNSMAFSVEARYPFLDHELIELALSFDAETLYKGGWTKMPLRVGLAEELPAKVRDRRTKFGLQTPQDKWLGGPLRSLVEGWLKEDRPLWQYLDRATIHDLVQRTFSSGREETEAGQAVFRALVFDRWIERFDVRGPDGPTDPAYMERLAEV